jgi:NhaP-type Na+/H+ or K+/H+ antiporter
MRGIVTLAAAIALPPSFPQRDLILFTAFFVVLGTLVLQGLTLKTLLRALDLRDGDPVSVESRTARKRVLEAALAAAPGGSSEAVDLVRTAFKVRLVAGTEAAVRPEPVRTKRRRTVLHCTLRVMRTKARTRGALGFFSSGTGPLMGSVCWRMRPRAEHWRSELLGSPH